MIRMAVSTNRQHSKGAGSRGFACVLCEYQNNFDFRLDLFHSRKASHITLISLEIADIQQRTAMGQISQEMLNIVAFCKIYFAWNLLENLPP